MRILALDLATRTGYAHSGGESGSWLLKTAGEAEWLRVSRLWEKLYGIFHKFGIDKIVAEACHVRFAKAAGPLYELRGATKAFCSHLSIDFDGSYAPTTIKKHASGHGVTSKEDMLFWAEMHFEKRIEHHDEADALWLLDLWKTQNAVASAS